MGEWGIYGFSHLERKVFGTILDEEFYFIGVWLADLLQMSEIQ